MKWLHKVKQLPHLPEGVGQQAYWYGHLMTIESIETSYHHEDLIVTINLKSKVSEE
jgi:hypothetical protein